MSLPTALSFHSGDIGRLWRILSQKGQKLTRVLGDPSGCCFQSKLCRGEGRRGGTQMKRLRDQWFSIPRY